VLPAYRHARLHAYQHGVLSGIILLAQQSSYLSTICSGCIFPSTLSYSSVLVCGHLVAETPVHNDPAAVHILQGELNDIPMLSMLLTESAVQVVPAADDFVTISNGEFSIGCQSFYPAIFNV